MRPGRRTAPRPNSRCAAPFDARNEAAEREFQDADARSTERYTARKAAVESEYAAKHDSTAAKLQAEYDALQKEYESIKAKATARFAADQAAANRPSRTRIWKRPKRPTPPAAASTCP